MIERRHRPWLIALIGFLLCFAVWPLSNPPFAAPDEPAHYIRAVAVATGHVGASAVVRIPGGLWGTWRAPNGPACNRAESQVPAACTNRVSTLRVAALESTSAGNYEPLAYAVPGVVLRVASGPDWADRIARIVSLLPCLALVTVALVLLRDERSPLSFLGGVLALTPMVAFVCGSLTPSGLEIASGLAFGALLMRMTRRDSAPPGMWLLFAIVGSVLALTRSTGIVWVVLDCAFAAILAGTAKLQALLRGRAPRSAGLAVLVAVCLNRVWEAVYGSTLTQSGFQSGSTLSWLPYGFRQLPRLFRESIGVFGWLDAWMPAPIYDLWFALSAVVVVVALAVGSTRHRLVLMGILLADALVAALISASLEASTHTDVQGRHLLGFTVMTPLIAGEILFRNRDRVGRAGPLLFGVIGLAMGGTQLVGVLANARRQGVGDGRPWLDILRDPAWSPPLGWPVWLAIGAAGATLIAASALDVARRDLPRR